MHEGKKNTESIISAITFQKKLYVFLVSPIRPSIKVKGLILTHAEREIQNNSDEIQSNPAFVPWTYKGSLLT
jgi:hypothetical protein